MSFRDWMEDPVKPYRFIACAAFVTMATVAAILIMNSGPSESSQWDIAKARCQEIYELQSNPRQITRLSTLNSCIWDTADKVPELNEKKGLLFRPFADTDLGGLQLDGIWEMTDLLRYERTNMEFFGIANSGTFRYTDSHNQVQNGEWLKRLYSLRLIFAEGNIVELYPYLRETDPTSFSEGFLFSAENSRSELYKLSQKDYLFKTLK